jgi:hypothetical protein
VRRPPPPALDFIPDSATPHDSTPAPLRATARAAATAVARAAGSAPATWLLALVIALVAGWEARARTLPNPGGPWIGAMLAAAMSVVFYAVLVLAYGAIERSSAASAARLARRVGLAILLALVSTQLVKITANPLLRPLDWMYFHYLRRFLAPAFAVLWCAVLLPRETMAITRAARRRDVAPLVALALLLLAGAALVSAGDFAFQHVGSDSPVQRQLARDLIKPRPWATTTLILFVVLSLVFAVTSSVTVSVVLVSPIFAAMVFATLGKIRFMHSAVQPLDLLTLPELLPLLGTFFGSGAIVASVAGIVLWLGALVYALRRLRTPMSHRHRWAIGITSFVLLVACIGVFLPRERLPGPLAQRGDAVEALTIHLGAPPGGQFRESARSYGIVLTFLSELRSAFVTVPRAYSSERVDRTMRAYSRRVATAPAVTRSGGVSLVIYLVESFMDPTDLGLRYSVDPMPRFRATAAEQVHGHAIVPYTFGGSAETEFELLTGMSTSFLPVGSIPFRQYIRRPLPALPRMLHDLGYASVAVQAGPRTYYDRERVEPLLGFDRTIWPYGAPGVALAERAHWPSDDAIVDSVIATSELSRPFFVFAFPASSHSPYTTGKFARSDLAVAGAPTAAATDEATEYAYAVRAADHAIGRLVDHFRGRRDSVIIAIMGDHLPPLSSEVLQHFTRKLTGLEPVERTRALHATPLLVWANFKLPPGELTTSTNLLPAYLLERMGVTPMGLFAVTDSVRRTLPVAGVVAQGGDGRLWMAGDVPPALRGPLDDYRLLQYDLLLGEQFALQRR